MTDDLAIGERAVVGCPHSTKITPPDVGFDGRAGEFTLRSRYAERPHADFHFAHELGADLKA